MSHENLLDNLQKRNNQLKSKLMHEQLKHDNFIYENYKKYSLKIIREYKIHKSIFKAASNVGIDLDVIMNWYVQGQMGNSNFRGFYVAIRDR